MDGKLELTPSEKFTTQTSLFCPQAFFHGMQSRWSEQKIMVWPNPRPKNINCGNLDQSCPAGKQLAVFVLTLVGIGWVGAVCGDNKNSSDDDEKSSDDDENSSDGNSANNDNFDNNNGETRFVDLGQS
jgi:hypothetical protein